MQTKRLHFCQKMAPPDEPITPPQGALSPPFRVRPLGGPLFPLPFLPWRAVALFSVGGRCNILGQPEVLDSAKAKEPPHHSLRGRLGPQWPLQSPFRTTMASVRLQ